MSIFKKLSQINKDIEILEAAGKIKSAEVLHQKFIKEAQAQPNTRYFSEDQKNYVTYGPNSTTSVRDGRSTNFNFTGLDPEMQLVRTQSSPGNPSSALIPKGADPRMADPTFANAQRIKAQENSIPGYNDFIKLKPQPFQIRDFMEARGTSTDAGMAIYNDLLSKNQGSNKPLPTSAPIPASTSTAPVAANGLKLSKPSQLNNVNDEKFLNTPKLKLNQPQSTNSIGDTANYNNRQLQNPNAQQESNEQRLYMNALNDIINGFASKDPTLISQAEQLYKGTLNSFKNPKRQKAFIDQIQRQRVKYLKPQQATNILPNFGFNPQAPTNLSPNFGFDQGSTR